MWVLHRVLNIPEEAWMREYTLKKLNIVEYADIYLKKKQSVEYARIILNVSDAVHNIRLL